MLWVRRFLRVGVEKIPPKCCFNETVEVFLKTILSYSLEKKKANLCEHPELDGAAFKVRITRAKQRE